MRGNSLSPNSLQCRHLQRILEISLHNSWNVYRSRWEFIFQILHLTKKIRTVPISQVASLLLVPLNANKKYLLNKIWYKWDKLHNYKTFHTVWKNVFPHNRTKSLEFCKVWTFFTFYVQSKTIISQHRTLVHPLLCRIQCCNDSWAEAEIKPLRYSE